MNTSALTDRSVVTVRSGLAAFVAGTAVFLTFGILLGTDHGLALSNAFLTVVIVLTVSFDLRNKLFIGRYFEPEPLLAKSSDRYWRNVPILILLMVVIPTWFALERALERYAVDVSGVGFLFLATAGFGFCLGGIISKLDR